jgi:hypothetical protein
MTPSTIDTRLIELTASVVITRHREWWSRTALDWVFNFADDEGCSRGVGRRDKLPVPGPSPKRARCCSPHMEVAFALDAIGVCLGFYPYLSEDTRRSQFAHFDRDYLHFVAAWIESNPVASDRRLPLTMLASYAYGISGRDRWSGVGNPIPC